MPDSTARLLPLSPAALVGTERAMGELRRGGMVLLRNGTEGGALMQAAEVVDGDGLARLRRLSAGAAILALTATRALGLGVESRGNSDVALFAIPGESGAAALRRWADPTAAAEPLPGPAHPTSVSVVIAHAAVELTKLARLLPAAVIGPLGAAQIRDPAAWAAAQDVLSLSIEQVFHYQTAAARSLRMVGEARVPLADANDARIVAFRPSDGGTEHLAIIIGAPSPSEPVLTRLHSECFTGDLLGSLRCDCGDQLRGAIAEIARQGSGVLLYLAQEGRGIGLVNKLRAYTLQDRGADTMEANQQLGFDADERVYLPAAEMLRGLGFRKVRLMTNNPEKVAGLGRCGIAVVERVPHVFPANAHNDRYLQTKAAKFGHLF